MNSVGCSQNPSIRSGIEPREMSLSYVVEKLPGGLIVGPGKSKKIKRESKSYSAIKVNYPENFNMQ